MSDAGDAGESTQNGESGREAKVRLTVGGFVVAGLVGLALEATLLPPEGLPFGVQSLFIAVGAAAGMWLVAGEL